MTRLSALAVLPILLLSACSASDDGGNGDSDKEVSRDDYGAEWPLTVDSGTLECKGSGGVGEATITVDGTKYALNGIAKGNDAYADIRPIWADSPDFAGVKQDISVLIEDALPLCE